MRIIIDGYNLLHVWLGERARQVDWQNARSQLLKRLQNYQALRRHRLTVVFDGWKSGWPLQQARREGGVCVIFSRQGETADDLIKRLVCGEPGGTGALVVSSDREIVDAVERAGAQAVSAREFEERLQLAEYLALKGEAAMAGEGDFCYEDAPDKPLGSKKKGNPRRLPRKQRRRRQRLNKL